LSGVCLNLSIYCEVIVGVLAMLDWGSVSGCGIEGNEKDPSSFFMYEFLLHSLALFYCVISFEILLERQGKGFLFVGREAGVFSS
jgi:hypothetical protein